MGKKKVTARRAEVDVNASIEPFVARARDVLEREGVLARAALVKLGLPKTRIDEAIEKLERLGFEATPKVLRRPLVEQLVDRLANGNAISMKTITVGLVGGSKREIADAVAALVDAGKAYLVVRTKEIALLGAQAAVIRDADLEALEEIAGQLLKTTKLARKKGATLLRADVTHALHRFIATDASVALAGHKKSAARDSNETLVSLVDRHRDKTGLTFVPTIVRALGGEAARDDVHAALLRGARSGMFELRPESGMGRLSAEDISFCIPGPQGSRLSWVRRVDSER